MPEPHIILHRDPATDRFSWKLGNTKGARWHSNCRDMDEAVKAAVAALPPGECEIEFVEAKD